MRRARRMGEFAQRRHAPRPFRCPSIDGARLHRRPKRPRCRETGKKVRCADEHEAVRTIHRSHEGPNRHAASEVCSSFEAYVQKRHEVSKGHANKRIMAARAADAITKVAPIGAKIKSESLALAPLAKENPEKAARAARKNRRPDQRLLPATDAAEQYTRQHEPLADGD